MTYQDTLHWMYSQLPMYQRQGKSAFRKDLSNTHKLAEYLGNPERKFKSVHVAGTNGKGSTSHMIASVLQEAGYKTGLYTSPHLKDFRERIRIDGLPVTKPFVIGFVKRNKTFFNTHSLSFFEMTVGMAFDYFAKKKVDIAVIEVGMGGRLDSTNIIIPEVSVITNIGLDHTQFLGDTLEAIAYEKAGIIKPQVPVVIGETQTETVKVFRKISKANQSNIVFADQEIHQDYKSDLKGFYQTKNIKTAIQTIKILKAQGYKISNSHIDQGLLKVTKNTGLLGRWQVLNTSPKVVCDTGHNREGLELVMEQLSQETFKNLHVVFGVVNDKDLSSIAHLLPKQGHYYLCKPNIPRGMDVDKLFTFMTDSGFKCQKHESVGKAYQSALHMASKEDFIFIGGSTFVVAEVL